MTLAVAETPVFCGPGHLVMAEITFKVTVITSSVDKISFFVDKTGLGRVLDKSTRVQVQVLGKMTSTSTSTSTGF